MHANTHAYLAEAVNHHTIRFNFFPCGIKVKENQAIPFNHCYAQIVRQLLVILCAPWRQ